MYVGFCAGGLRWCSAVRTVFTAVCLLGRWGKIFSRKANRLEAEDREDNRATSVSEQSSLWPQSVPGWQPSCERLPPASWAVVGMVVGMMALCCAVVCCVEYSCSGPSINNSAAVFASRK